MLLVYEPAFGGHHLVYLQYILAGAAARDLEVRLVTSEALTQCPHFAERLGAFEVPLDVVMREPPRSGARGLRHHVAALRAAVQDHRPTDVLIPYLDGLLYVVPLLRRGPRYHGILFSPTPFVRRRKRMLARASLGLHRVGAFHHLDEELVARVGHPKLHWLADPVPTSPPEADAKRRLGLPTDRAVVLVAGVLTRRKGVAQLLEAAASPQWPPGADLVLVGRPDAEVAALLSEARSPHVVVRDEHVDDEAFARWFRAADVVAATYPTYLGSSGIVLNAAAAGTPILALDRGWIGRAVRENDLGVVIPELSPGTLLQGLRDALRLASDPSWSPREAFVRAHSVPAFQEQLFRYLSC